MLGDLGEGPRNDRDFPGGSDSKESACNVGNLGSIPGLGRSPGQIIIKPDRLVHALHSEKRQRPLNLLSPE